METIHFCLFLVLCLGVDGLASETLQRQKRNWIIDSFTIDEGYRGSYPYSLGIIKVEKNLSLFQINGQGVDEEPKGILKINSFTGEVTVHGPVDHERYTELKLVFLALDRDSRVIDTRLGIEIRINDANDNPPKFDNEKYEVSIKELTLQGTDVITVRATDEDSGNNKIFDLQIISISPKSDDVEFYLTQISGTQTGTISFKGCLDYEKAEKHIIIVEAKDRGDELQLSSSCTIIINIEDGNNHLPVITGQTGPGKVKEGQENVLVSLLQVTDKDRKGTAAWKVKYQIQGDTYNNFIIKTDPDTNEGQLYVKKRLDYEESPAWNVTISMENELPYYSCTVESKSTAGLWTVTTISATGTGTGPGQTLGSSTYQVTVMVEDVNEPPIFDEPVQNVQLYENVVAGQDLVTFTARDPDVNSESQFVYVIGEDPAGWVTVDSKTGKVSTSKTIDRESPFVNGSIYEVTIYAIDNGEPAMTSTATLSIHIKDENDNTPTLTETQIDMCQSDGPSRAKITAMDLDEEPYGGPFSFKLHGDVDGKWRFDPTQGYSVNLVKEDTVHSGHHELVLEVSDAQGETAVQNLSVTVCNCLDTENPNCNFHRSTASTIGGRAAIIVVFSILLLAAMLLLAALVSCKREFRPAPDNGSGQYLKSCNTEEPGTDCKVAFDALNQGCGQTTEQIIIKQPVYKLSGATVTDHHASSGYSMSQSEIQQQGNNLQWFTGGSASETTQACLDYSQSQRQRLMEQTFSRNSSKRWSKDASSTMKMNLFKGQSMHRSWGGHSKNLRHENVEILHETLFKTLDKMLTSLQAPGLELCNYTPHVYAEEGETRHDFELDAISIPDVPFDPDSDLDLDIRFSTLASICMPNESTVYNTKTYYVTE
ncbi:cadherin-like protein 26 [Trachinotus anak]|uniref:cadherin-like protein 26 n=1 Tax=Trachinotus anak TaxID=443729 RepID=UPI0039F1CD9F